MVTDLESRETVAPNGFVSGTNRLRTYVLVVGVAAESSPLSLADIPEKFERVHERLCVVTPVLLPWPGLLVLQPQWKI